MEFEDILKAVGEYGRYQKKLVYFYIIPTTTVFAIYCMNTFFMLSIPDAWCTVPELAHLSPALQQALSRPLLNGSLDLLDSCSHYSLNYSQVLHRYEHSWNQDNFSLSAEEKKASTSSCSNGWTFDKSNFDETAVSYLGLVCDQANWVALILTIHGIGEVLGNPFFGSLSDTLGRRLTFFLTLAVAVASSSSPIIFRGLWVFAISRFFNSATAASMFNLPYIILTELVGPQYRTRLIGIAATTWSLGMCILPYLAYVTRDWIVLAIVPTVCVIPMFCYWNFLPESPRWLLSRGKIQEAHDIMAMIAKENSMEVPDNLFESLQAISKKATYEESQNSSKGSLFDILKRPGLRTKFLLITLGWTANVTAYRGITLNFQNFEGSEFRNWFLLAVVEFPSNILSWYLMDTRLGRRWANSLTMSLGGLSLCLPMVMPASWPSGVIVASLFGKCLCNMAYNVVYQQTAELFPTPVRNQGMSYSSAIGAGANFALPYLASLGKFRVWLPLVIMGAVCLTSGILSAFLPETLFENLPQTLEDGDSFGKDQKFFSLARKRPSVQQDEGAKPDKVVYRKVNKESS